MNAKDVNRKQDVNKDKTCITRIGISDMSCSLLIGVIVGSVFGYLCGCLYIHRRNLHRKQEEQDRFFMAMDEGYKRHISKRFIPRYEDFTGSFTHDRPEPAPDNQAPKNRDLPPPT